ncbi:MAG: trypsin-like peptidase domain-containing protein [Lachnospiraceae bacterium]|nr:trypsin-like peptidase domain-containing protein [Lachnospiraceae bacterium]
MRRTTLSAMIGSIVVSLTVAFTASVSVCAQELPPHLIQTVTEQDIFEGMLALGYLETPVLDTEDCGEAYEKVKNCVVRIQMGNAHGSGIIWEISSERIVIVTNKHVLDYWSEENGYVHFPQGFDMDAQLLGTSEHYDVGFVAVYNSQFTYEELQKLRCARVSQNVCEGLKQGDMMFLVDSGSMEEDAKYYVGTVGEPYQYIEDLDAYMLYAHCFAKTGMSGGGTFDGHGFLIGMTTAGTAQNESASVPVQHINLAYEEVVEDTF